MKPTHLQWIAPFLLSLFLLSCAAPRQLKMADRNKETIRLWFEEGWNHNRNEELIEKCFDLNWKDGNPLRPNQLEGHEGIRQLVKYYRNTFTESHFKITHLLADEKFASVRYEVSAIHSAQAFGIAPTGKHFTSTGIVIYEMAGGKIKTSWQELDLMGILNQLKD